MIQAIIFDMDGTLYDTEQIYGRAWLHAGLSKEQYARIIGSSQKKIREWLTSWGMDADEMIQKRTSYVDRELKNNGIPIKPGARECLMWAREHGYRCAVASSSSASIVEQYLSLTNMTSFFSVMLGGDDVERGKPNPDLFLFASKLLQKDPSYCLVVEDSYNGVRAGKNAGMTTVMIPDKIPPDEEMRTLADAILSSLNELPSYLNRMEHKKGF